MLKISAFLFNASVDLHESSTIFNCCNIISRQWWSNLIRFMNENLFNVKIIILNSTTRYESIYAPTSALYSQKWYPWDHGVLRAVNSLQL